MTLEPDDRTAPLELLQLVRLARDVPDAGLTAGTLGTVVDLLRGDGDAHEVEVVDDAGRTSSLGRSAQRTS